MSVRIYDYLGRDISNCPNKFCNNPACLGEPWCSAWGICRGEAAEREQGIVEEARAQAQPGSGSGLEQEYDILELSQQQQQSSPSLLSELPQSSSSPLLPYCNTSVSQCQPDHSGSSQPTPAPLFSQTQAKSDNLVQLRVIQKLRKPGLVLLHQRLFKTQNIV